MSLTLLNFFDGRVPYTKWACVRLRSWQSDWIDNQAALLVNVSFTLSLMISSVDTLWTTQSSDCLIKEQIYHIDSSQVAALRLAKCQGTVTQDKYVDTRALAENSPLLGKVSQRLGHNACCLSGCTPCVSIE